MRAFLTAMLFAWCVSLNSAQMPESLKVKEHKLSNGLTVWLNEDHSQPKVFGAIVVKAGAKDCPDTGIAHYFEHMMFKGTDKIGTTDYEAEKLILDSIAVKYDELAQNKDEKVRKEIQKEINELSLRAAEYAIPNEFNSLISKYGGTGLNAGTSYDFTVYHNTFSPQYFAHWAEINSERLINPVFRLFQSELETVYEEKNMYTDMMGMQAMEKLTHRYFYPHPYAYPIVGSTENLKNPRLSEMREFFEKYYVASNMGLILCGDFDTEKVLPILESTFSRVPEGEAPQRETVVLPPFKGKEKITIKVPVPFVKILALGFRGVPVNHEDQVALNVAIGILNNENGTGYLDKLMVNHKVMTAMSMNQSLNEAGILGLAVVPKLLFQTYSSAEKLVWNEINRVKNGDFTDEAFNALKLEQKRKYESALENIDSWAQMMFMLFSQGKSWDEYINEMSCINALTKEDVVAVARKYFGDDYLYIKKKTGRYPKDNLPKPDFKPIAPHNTDAKSEYARKVEQLPVTETQTRFIDFDKDVRIVQLTPKATLYSVHNPVNEIFTLSLTYGIGTWENPMLNQLKTYLPFLGTDSMTFDEFRGKLQTLGSTLDCDADKNRFILKVTGFDSHFDETMELVGNFIKHVKADDKKLKQVVDEEKVIQKAFFKSSDDVAGALLNKVRYGDKSTYLTKLSLSEVKKLKGKDLIALFDKVKTVACDFHYSGTLSASEVAKQIEKNIELDKITLASNSPIHNELQVYNKPKVYFFDDPKVAQSIVYGYVLGGVTSADKYRNTSKLLTNYFGGDMSSIMFQEIREFRSLAYRVSAKYELPSRKHWNEPGSFMTMLSTQSDKTVEALQVLVDLINNMPVKPEKLEAAKQSIVNSVNNSYPSFRKLSEKVAAQIKEGYTEDGNKDLLSDISQMSMEDVISFYESNIKNRPIVFAIVGNSRKIDMDKLASFGEIVKVKKTDIYK